MRNPRGEVPLWAMIAASILTCGWGLPAASSLHDYTVEVSAAVHESPPRIDVTWPADATAEQYYVFRKGLDDADWGTPLAILPGTATSFSDFDVAVGQAYEYAFEKNLGVWRDTVTVAAGTSLIFQIDDSWGDGICCEHGVGSYAVGGCGLVYASGGAFGLSQSTSFVTGGPGGSCNEVTVAVILDLYGQETTWRLVEEAGGTVLAQGGPYEPPRFGHLVAGIHCPAMEDRGAILVLTEASLADSLVLDLERLREDLIGDGYRVHHARVDGGAAVTSIKALILTTCAADPSIETLLLLGHVPVPYSGNVWSSHLDHRGAWPADGYYGELDGDWTDTEVNVVNAYRPENRNVPGDGKFDQTRFPSDVDLQVGRVDLSRMPAFGSTEIQLMRRYLDKDHAFRTGAIDVEARGLVDDNFGVSYGHAPSATAWRHFNALMGPGSIVEGDFFPDLQTGSCLWAYGCGPASFTTCSGVGSTNQFASHPVHAVFTALYGSYFGDWDNPDNLLRAPLAATGYPLVCFWSGRPIWRLQHMGLGFPIGYCARLTENNFYLYRSCTGDRGVHIALMGDPTLRLYAVRPVTDLRIDESGAGTMELEWEPSPDATGGYLIQRAPTITAAFERLTPAPILATSFVDTRPLPGVNVYMVRALGLQTTGSGSYEELSCGTIDSLVSASVPDLRPPAFRLAVHPPLAAGPVHVRLELAQPCDAIVRVIDVAGAAVRNLCEGPMAAGVHDLVWDGSDGAVRRVASGVYFVQVRSAGKTAVRRVAIVR